MNNLLPAQRNQGTFLYKQDVETIEAFWQIQTQCELESGSYAI